MTSEGYNPPAESGETPREIAKRLVNNFPGELSALKDADGEMLARIAELDGTEIDVEQIHSRAAMFRSILGTLHAKAGNAIPVGSQLEKGEQTEQAISFLEGEIGRYQQMIEVLKS